MIRDNKYHFVRAALRSALNLAISAEADPANLTEDQMLDVCVAEVWAHYNLTKEAQNESRR